MTLYRELVLIIVLMCLLIFLGTLGVNIHSTRLFLNAQLQSHAQDTATSLSLSLSPHMAENDVPTMTSMIDAIFDRGYYSEIRLLSIEGGDTLIERVATPELEGVPRFVVDWVDLETPQAAASVMSGWNLGGVIHIKSHPGYAYRQLWRITIRMLTWFVLVALGIGAIGALGIHALLKPLRAVEKQAEGVCAREYEIQEGLPRTRELRRVVIAMNRMTAKVKTMFDEQAQSAERMRELAYQDTLTGLGNRRFFEGQLHAAVRACDDLHQSALLLIQIKGLQEINDQRGFEAGDDLIRAASGILKTCVGPESTMARLAGADFGVLLANVERDQVALVAANLIGHLADLHGQGVAADPDVSHAGVTLFAGDQLPGALLAQADQALRGAQAQGPNSWQMFAAETATTVSLGRHEWKQRLEQVTRDRSLVLHVQPVVDVTDRNALLHREVLVRIPSEDDGLWTAGAFMPVAEELGVARQLDRIMLLALTDHLLNGADGADYAVNLSPGCLQDGEFLQWLYQMLERTPADKGRLIIEFSEFGVVRELEALRAVSRQVRSLGHGIGLDHFGQAFAAFGYLQSLRPDYVKIDGGYTARVIDDRDDQFFVQNLCSIAHSLDIRTIAEMVETEAQWDVLKSLQVDGIQGYAVGRPAPLRG